MELSPHPHASHKPSRLSRFIHKHRRWLIPLGWLILLMALLFGYFNATSPYSRFSIIKPAFSTAVEGDHITIKANYTPHSYSRRLANFVGIYVRGAWDMVWNRIESPKLPRGDYNSIVYGIHALRFDPTKPYLISGDQFNAL